MKGRSRKPLLAALLALLACGGCSGDGSGHPGAPRDDPTGQTERTEPAPQPADLQPSGRQTSITQPADPHISLPQAGELGGAAERYAWLSTESYESIASRFAPPDGFSRLPAEPGSFGEWLRGLPLAPGRPPVHLHDGRLKADQSAHEAVVLIDVGDRDLQQCADAVIRLRAEYLLARGCEEEIAFHFTSGDLAAWSAWREGSRPQVRGPQVTWSRTAREDGSRAGFRRYLDMVFEFAGSASLAAEMEPVGEPSRVEIGDVFVQGGSPGHAVLVVDVAENGAGERAFLMAQSYMPAQEIHVLRRPGSPDDPWFRASERGPLVTPEWVFRREDLRRFRALRCEGRGGGPSETSTDGEPPTTGAVDADRTSAGWRTLEPGLDLGSFRIPQTAARGDSILRVVRVDPQRWELRLLNASAPGRGRALTAKEWARRERLAVAINTSMYQTDHRTSVGLMRTRDHVNNPRLSKEKTILAFDRLDDGAPPVKIIDRECEEFDAWRGRYGTLVQSIRMISCKGRNIWSQQPRQWSTAAIGTDGDGRVLLMHVRSPYSVHDLIDNLRSLPLGLERAMYAEGGPEAQLYVRAGGEEHEFVGSYETDFLESDSNVHAWPVPNVIGVVERPAEPRREEGAGEGGAAVRDNQRATRGV